MRDSVKIISLFGDKKYADKFPELPLIREENLFLECRCHDVCLPVVTAQSDALNIFEETVLRLLGIFGKSVEEISECSCLEKDFVQAICYSLRQRNFVNENNVISDVGKDYLNNTNISENVDQKAVRVLSLPDKGILLAPILQDFKSEYDGFFDGKILSTTINSQDIGNSTSLKGRFRTIPKEKISRPVYAHDVRKIIREYNRTSTMKIRLADGYAMSISKSGSRVFLHLKCAIQSGLVEHPVVSDGTSMISGVLVQYLMENHSDYVDGLFKRATISEAEKEISSERFSREKYYNVKHNLEELETFSPATDPDTERANRERRKNNLNRLNAAVEHALNYYLKKYPLSAEREKILYSQTPAENHRTLLTFAKQLNLNIGGNTELLSRISKWSFERYKQSDVPSLHFVVPLAIISGVENRTAPFAEAVQKMPNLFELFNILNRTKSFRHGSEDEKFLPKNYSEIVDDVNKFISLILPDYSATETPIENSTRITNISQEKLNAIVELKRMLGNKIYCEVGDNLRNDLIRLSPYYKGNRMLSPMDFVNCLYRCLENYIRVKTRNFSVKQKNREEILLEIERLTDSALPNAIKSVSQKMFVSAMSGENASLGAYVLVMFGALPKELLTDKGRVKKFLDDIGEIIELRQHANNTELNLILTEGKLCRLRENTFNAMKFGEEF